MIGATPLELLAFRGRISSAIGGIDLDDGRLRVAGNEIQLRGQAGAARLAIRGQLSAMSLEAVKVMWPAVLAPGARRWIGQQVTHGHLASGSFTIDDAPPGAARGGGPGFRFAATFEAGNVRVLPKPGLPPVEAAKALIRLDGNALEIAVPEATVLTSPQRRLPLRSVRMVSADVASPRATADLTFTALGPLPAALELVEQVAARSGGRGLSVPGENIDGRVDAQMRISVPLGELLGPDDVRVEGKGRILDGRAKAVFGNLDVQGATIAFELAEHSIDAKGELLMAGVPAKLTWGRIFGATDEDQPKLNVRATIDTSDSRQLGIDLSRFHAGRGAGRDHGRAAHQGRAP